MLAPEKYQSADWHPYVGIVTPCAQWHPYVGIATPSAYWHPYVGIATLLYLSANNQ